ncbi:MAG: hypothetical protein L0J56_10275, partial [Halomonas sp.]
AIYINNNIPRSRLRRGADPNQNRPARRGGAAACRRAFLPAKPLYTKNITIGNNNTNKRLANTCLPLKRSKDNALVISLSVARTTPRSSAQVSALSLPLAPAMPASILLIF